MTKEGIDKLIAQGEGINIEFKECLYELNAGPFLFTEVNHAANSQGSNSGTTNALINHVEVH
jgi:hypothetical protein